MCLSSLVISHTLQKRGSQKGYIDLTKVKVVEKVLNGAFDKPSFQVSGEGNTSLCVVCEGELVSFLRRVVVVVVFKTLQF